MDQETNIELRSEEVKEILGRTPNWIIRSGITMFFLVISILVVGSWFFRYPDTISSRLVLTTVNPPAELVARASGKIQVLYVEDNQDVEKDELLAIVENAAFSDDIFLIREKLLSLREHITKSQNIETNLFWSNFRLGEVQPYYNSFFKAYVDYCQFFEFEYYDIKIDFYKEQIKNYSSFYHRQDRQKTILERELYILEEQYSRDSLLFARGVLSQAEFQETYKEYLSQNYAFHGAMSSLAATKIDILKTKQELKDLIIQKEKEEEELQNLLTQSYDNLMAQLDIWEQRYLIKTPIDGKVSFNKFWSQNQNVWEGEKVFTILPSDSTEIFARLELGIKGAGKVKVGQRVNIKLDNYPYLEYGMLNGTIKSISNVPNDKKYTLGVEFPNGLVTNYGIKLDFAQQIEGEAEIITEDLRLMQRVFNPMRALFKKGIR